MASLEQLGLALKNADAAGDVDAARALAGEIKRMRGTEGNAITDIGPEIRGAFNENLAAFKQGFGLEGKRPGEKGAIEGALGVGRGLLAIPGMAAAPITGAARSLLGHGLANATQAAGSIINPEVAAKEDPREVYEASKAGVDTAMMAMAPRGASPVGMRPMPAKVPTAPELKQAAVSVYESPQIKGLQIAPNDVVNLTGGLQNDLIKSGFRPTAGSAPGTFAELQRMTPDPSIPSVSVDDLRAARRAFGGTSKQVQPDMSPTPDAVAAKRAIEKIDDFLDNLAPELRDANANYAAGKRAQMLDYRTMKADRNAAKSGSGMNMENAMRQAVDKIGDRGLSKQEIAARDRIVLGSKPRNALRTAGKLGVDGGLSLMLHAGAGLGSGGATVPITAAGTMARKIGELLTRREISALSKTMRSKSPLARALNAQPQFAKIPKGAKAIAAALLSQNAQRPMIGSVMPAYAQEDQK
jgi:hypothetical protein